MSFKKINKLLLNNIHSLFIINVLKAISTSASVLLLGKIIQFILLLYLAKYLGPESFTILASSLIIAQLIGLITIPGGRQGLTASITRALAEKNQSLCKSILLNSIYLCISLNALLIISTILLNYFFSTSLINEFMLVTLIMLFTMLRTSITRGYGYIFTSLFFSEVMAPLFLLLIIILSTYKNIVLSIPLLWLIVHGIFEVFVILISRKRILNTLNHFSSDISFPIKAFKETFSIQVANIFLTIITRIDMLILSFVSGPLAAAPYALAQRFVQPITMLGRVLSNSTSPMLTKAHAGGKIKNINQIISLSFSFVVIGSIFIILFLYWMYDLIVGYLSTDYSLNETTIIYLIGSQLCLVVSAPFAQYLLMTKKPNQVTFSNIAACIMFLTIVIFNLDQISSSSMAKYSFVATFFMAIMSISLSIRALIKNYEPIDNE